MPENRIVTLLSDFGLSDVYVGVMKGVIAQINPALTLVDLTHQIPPQNIAAARFSLMNAYPYFPAGTVHIAVVDPGVGSHRRAIALQLDTGFLVGPDNGLFSGVFNQTRVVAAVELTNPKYWRTPIPSTTFHGRDIFATAGAYLATGVALEQLGEVIDPKTLVQLAIPERTRTATGIAGCIQYIDHFGNLITNIPAADVQGKTWSVVVSDSSKSPLSDRESVAAQSAALLREAELSPQRSADRIIQSRQTYSDSLPVGFSLGERDSSASREAGEVVTLIGSHGWVEIAVNGGNAQSKLQLNWGAKVQVVFT